jgi:hypothetical protein
MHPQENVYMHAHEAIGKHVLSEKPSASVSGAAAYARRYVVCRPSRRHPPPQRMPEPTPVERRIAEIWRAMKDGRLTRTQAQIGETVLSLFHPYKNGDHGIRNQCGDVLTEYMILEAYEARYGTAVSRRTISAWKVRMVECFEWFGWRATPAGTTFQMQADGVMPMRGKRGKLLQALCSSLHNGKNLAKKQASNKGRKIKTVSCGERDAPPPGTAAATRPSRPSPPPDPVRADTVAAKIARLAAWEPTAAEVEFGLSLHLTEREIQGEAARMRAWFVQPDHPERRAWAPADPSAMFAGWLERGAAKKAKRKAQREAAELRRQEADLLADDDHAPPPAPANEAPRPRKPRSSWPPPDTSWPQPDTTWPFRSEPDAAFDPLGDNVVF